MSELPEQARQALLRAVVKAFNPNQPRDVRGRWERGYGREPGLPLSAEERHAALTEEQQLAFWRRRKAQLHELPLEGKIEFAKWCVRRSGEHNEDAWRDVRHWAPVDPGQKPDQWESTSLAHEAVKIHLGYLQRGEGSANHHVEEVADWATEAAANSYHAQMSEDDALLGYYEELYTQMAWLQKYQRRSRRKG